jgi:hypothetical protein
VRGLVDLGAERALQFLVRIVFSYGSSAPVK